MTTKKRARRRSTTSRRHKDTPPLRYAEELPPPKGPDDRLVRIPYALKKWGDLSRWLHRELVNAGKLPAPFRMSARVAVYRESQVEEVVANGGRYP